MNLLECIASKKVPPERAIVIQRSSTPSEPLSSDFLFLEKQIGASIAPTDILRFERESELDSKEADIGFEKAKTLNHAESSENFPVKQKVAKANFKSGTASKFKPVSISSKVPLVRLSAQPLVNDKFASERNRFDGTKPKIPTLSKKSESTTYSKIPLVDDWFCDEENVSFANVKRHV
jgi:hypothetical protein